LANEKGNGGDSTRCDGKIRTLDSVIMNDQKTFKIVKNENSEASLSQIIDHFEKTYPYLAQRLKSFLQTYKDKGNTDENIYWIKGVPRDVKDENLFLDLPENCSTNLTQTVVLVKEPYSRYYYNSKVLAELEQEKDELSWLLIHEWLRDYNEDSDVIRLLNAYLHSSQFLNADEDETRNMLFKLRMNGRIGISLSTEKRIEEGLAFAIKNFEELLINSNKALDDFIHAGVITKKEEEILIEIIAKYYNKLDLSLRNFDHHFKPSSVYNGVSDQEIWGKVHKKREILFKKANVFQVRVQKYIPNIRKYLQD
jgi:hypothetical protein